MNFCECSTEIMVSKELVVKTYKLEYKVIMAGIFPLPGDLFKHLMILLTGLASMCMLVQNSTNCTHFTDMQPTVLVLYAAEYQSPQGRYPA